MFGAAPAMANTSAATAEIPTQIRGAQDNSIAGGDEQFQALFAGWESLDGDTVQVPAPTSSVSIPSRMPLNNSALTSNYGMRTHPVLGGRRAHKGVDLAAPVGTPIYATADGVVSKAERFSSYGLFVSIEHGAQLQTRFAHMSRIAVADGERVKKGDIIGYVGSTGRSTGPHLHYEVRVDGVAVNPIPYMVETDAQDAYALALADGGRGGE
ncbi:MAG: M23 family metallopeptidase [Pontixanthobacter sp.]